MIGPGIVIPGIAKGIYFSDEAQVGIFQTTARKKSRTVRDDFRWLGIDIARNAIGAHLQMPNIAGKPSRTDDAVGVGRQQETFD